MSSPLGRCYDLEGAAAALPADAHKLRVVGYSLVAVVSLPRRLANPPPRRSKLELAQVLARQHCSPISLADFENYLAYTEHSVENLRFTLWLQAYTAEHARLAQADSAVAARLSDSVATATGTYIEPGAPYEINLTDGTRSELLALPASPPPPPGAYEAARKEVQLFLEDSLTRWEKRAMPNAGWRRLAFSTYVGLFNALATVAAMVIARLYIHGKTGRIVAACLTPWLWCGIVGVICGLKGVCLLCYSAGGTVRQVSSFELALPHAQSGPSAHSASLASLAWPSSSDPDKKSETYGQFSPHSAREAEVVVKPIQNLRNHRAAVSKAMLVKLWAPMVAVEDPLVIRAHWEAVVQGFAWSFLLAVPMGVIAAAVGL